MTAGPPPRDASAPAPRADVAAAVAPRAPVASEVLFQGEKELQIAHGGAVYRLKQTALGKLILTK